MSKDPKAAETNIGDDEEAADRPAEEGCFQVRVKAKPAPVEQDLIVWTRLFTELNIGEKQVKDLKVVEG